MSAAILRFRPRTLSVGVLVNTLTEAVLVRLTPAPAGHKSELEIWKPRQALAYLERLIAEFPSAEWQTTIGKFNDDWSPQLAQNGDLPSEIWPLSDLARKQGVLTILDHPAPKLDLEDMVRRLIDDRRGPQPPRVA